MKIMSRYVTSAALPTMVRFGGLQLRRSHSAWLENTVRTQMVSVSQSVSVVFWGAPIAVHVRRYFRRSTHNDPCLRLPNAQSQKETETHWDLEQIAILLAFGGPSRGLGVAVGPGPIPIRPRPRALRHPVALPTEHLQYLSYLVLFCLIALACRNAQRGA